MSDIEKLIEEEERAAFEAAEFSFEEMAYETAMESRYEYNVDRAVQLTNDYLTAKQMVDDATAILAQIKPEIVTLHNQGISFPRLSITHSTRKGNVDMKKLCRDMNIMDTDLDKWRGKSIEIDTIKTKQ